MNYTWSKSLDNAGSVIPTTYFEPRPEYLFGDRMNWGPAATDRRHRVVVSYVWDLPTVDSNSFFARALVNGWQATGIFQSQTGPPLTIESGRDNSFTDIGNDRAVLTGESVERPESADKQRMFFNTGAFGINPIGTFGTVGRGTITGPSLTSWNVGLFKRWSISERTSVQFRAEFFNMLNNVNLYTPQTNVASGSFGRITSAEDPRIMQFGLKLLF
jgi:hypothetical protein